MKKYLNYIIAALITTAGFILAAGTADAAVLSISPGQKEFAIGETFLAEIRLNSEKVVVNAVQATVSYDTDQLEALSVSTGGTFLTLWAQEPAIEPHGGVITLAGGIPDGSMVFSGLVATVTFRTKQAGGVEVAFDPLSTSVHANDGQGTATPLTTNSAFYNITNKSLTDIVSPTHPDENTWYQENTLTVRWSTRADVRYSYVLSLDAEEKPDAKVDAGEGMVTYDHLSDGIYYFILNEQVADGEWQLAGRRRVMIDSASPEPISSLVTRESSMYDNKFILIFSTVDKGSGVDHYDVREGKKVTAGAVSPYQIQDQSRATTLSVTAFDKAGNSVTATFPGASSNPTAKYHYATVLVLVAAGLLILVLVYLFMHTKRKKQQV